MQVSTLYFSRFRTAPLFCEYLWAASLTCARCQLLQFNPSETAIPITVGLAHSHVAGRREEVATSKPVGKAKIAAMLMVVLHWARWVLVIQYIVSLRDVERALVASPARH
jgi:hypothetical protein